MYNIHQTLCKKLNTETVQVPLNPQLVEYYNEIHICIVLVHVYTRVENSVVGSNPSSFFFGKRELSQCCCIALCYCLVYHTPEFV